MLIDILFLKRRVVVTANWLQLHGNLRFREVGQIQLQLWAEQLQKTQEGSELNIHFATKKVKTLFINKNSFHNPI